MEKVEGVIVSDIKRGSVAEKAGLKVGDIILEANGEKVMDESSMIGVVDEAKPGETIRLKILRDRRSVSLDLRLDKKTL